MEVAGGVIGASSIAIQLAESIHKLYNFRKAVLDAPKHVNSLFRELKMLSRVLMMPRPQSWDPSQDLLEEEALLECQNLVLKLCSKLEKARLGLESPSRIERTWASVKKVLKDSEIEALRNSIQNATRTLVLLDTASLRLSSERQFHIQDLRLRELTGIVKHVLPDTISHFQRLSHFEKHSTMQIHEPCTAQQADFQSFSTTIQYTDNTDHCSTFPEQSVATSETVIRKTQQEIKASYCISTPLASVYTYSSSRVVTQKFRYTTQWNEHDAEYFLSPTALLQYIGISKGIRLKVTFNAGWTYTIQTFNSVPEDSLIFEFCRSGNVEAIKTLLSKGYASVRDRDPHGRTPLWVASQSLQVEVAQFLIENGADLHISDWQSKIPPMRAIKSSTDLDVSRKVSMISVFHTYDPEIQDDYDLLTLYGLLLLFYRPRKDFAYSIRQRNDAAVRIVQHYFRHFPQGDPGKTVIAIGLMQLHYSHDALHWVLQSIKVAKRESHLLHQALAANLLIWDPISVKLITERSEDLHFFDKLAPSRSVESMTPTTIVMYRPSTFYAWINIVVTLPISIDEFVRAELNSSPLRGEGWDEETLANLFRLDSDFIEGYDLHTERCQRCGSLGTSSFPCIDLSWRRYLRYLRTRCNVQDVTNKQEKLIVTWLNTSLPGLFEDRPYGWPYQLVCSQGCEDGICVAWVYDNNDQVEPLLPSFVSEEQRQSQWAGDGRSGEMDVESPVRLMPGSFIDD